MQRVALMRRGDTCPWYFCETTAVLEMRTNRWEFTVWTGLWLLCVQRCEVSLSKNVALAFLYDTLESLTFTFTTLYRGKAWIVLQKHIKKQILQTRTVIHSSKREQTTNRGACSLSCIHTPLASSINQVQLCSSYNEGKEVQVCISLRHFAWCFPFQ